MSLSRFVAFLVTFLIAGSGGAVAQDAPVPASISVVPAKIDLAHPRQPMAIQVMGASAEGYSLDLRGKATFISADPKIAVVDADGWMRPVSNGQTQITVMVGGQTKTVSVKAQLPATEPAMSFRHEVMPVLSKAGCNSGGCHGYSLGKNGFKLSLRGADPDPDYLFITKDSMSRRVNFQNPAASLLIAKAVGDAPHEGGVRFARTSLSNQILVNWIREGGPSDLADKAQVVNVRLVPDKLVLKPGQKHRVQLIAEYDNGSVRDVTRLGIIAANSTQYADVDEEGVVTAGDPGETAVVARFERVFAATSVMVLRPDVSFVATPVPNDHYIDKHVVEKLNRLKIAPSPISGDEEFLRRVYLDLIGVQPRPDEIKVFLADRNPKKRDAIIDALFARPEYVDHWSLKWGDLLQNSRTSASQQSVYLFREFIRSAIASNMPLDVFARKVLTARGGASDDPASVYFAISKDTNDTLERATQVFCGVRMLCARCHSHPMENWTQADYYGLASFFNQVSIRADVRAPQGVQNAKYIQLNLAAGNANNPRSGRPQAPKFLGGEEPKLDANADRRDAYARWLTSPKNPFFARSLVNRYWSYFFHRGIIEPVDDIRNTNPPINPALLDALTQDFIDSKFDVRHLIKRIVTSQTYQRSAVPTASNKHDEQNFSHAIPRRIPAEALLDSLIQATGVQENFPGVPAGFRAAQLPDANSENAFLRLFGKSQRMEACECERDNNSNMLQALHFLNGKSIQARVLNPNGRAMQLARQKLSDKEIVSELYLWAIARHPSGAELKIGEAYMQKAGAQRAEAVQDLLWALLNSRDFVLVH
ncbi:MAG: DUF1553 domain-containing protein [Planctomycetes bacterium]|nr:DUF1553 domain-containing protein [Planctomycetota bacterium]